MSKQKLLIATTNHGKLKEFRELFNDLDLEILCLSDLPSFDEVEETGKTFKENASLKALGYAKQTGMLTLGEDSGLSCDALDGAPGIYSARFAGQDKSDLDNNEKLLRLLASMPDNCRGAHYTSAIALAEPTQVIDVVEGEVHGFIAKEPVGDNGFGYDPLFYYPDFMRTFGQVSSALKQQVSHRSKAFQKFKTVLENYLKRSA